MSNSRVFRCQTPETFEEKHLAPGTALVVDGTIVAEMLELSAQNE